MFSSGSSSSVCFVWPLSDFNAAVEEEICKIEGVRIIVDISEYSLKDLPASAYSITNVDVKISLRQFFDPSLQEFIKDRGIRTVWLEYFAELLPCSFDVFIDQAKSFGHLTIVTGDIAFITYCFSNSPENCGLALKGSEASGFVGSETTLTLVSLVERLAEEHVLQIPVHIWGGAATPEAAAAFLASGMQSVVFESLHWLTGCFAQKYPAAAKSISQLRVEHSSLVKISTRLFFRAFNKGNSRVLHEITGSEDNTDDSTGGRVAGVFLEKAICALKSDFSRRQITPIGIETAFAGSFQQRFGRETSTAIASFSREVSRLVAQAPDILKRFFSSGISEEMGTSFPFIQGAMACISDVPAFAVSIAQAGGLPTLAFGMQDPGKFDEKYGALRQKLNGYPYAINVIALAENPFRDAQLSWIMKNPPPFVVISAGDPSFAVQLQEHDIRTIYVTSDVALLQLAWKRGIRYVVCEGHEAGGHVGEMSMLTLAQTVLELRRNDPEGVFRKDRLILAGGIFDRMSLFRAAFLGADAIQMGTAYLVTTEIVADGAMTDLYQRLVLASAAGDTTITGESVGLRVRSLLSPKIIKIQNIEKEYLASAANDSFIRKRLERESGGSLFIAARGINPFSGESLSEQECYEQGQFMSGAAAGMLSRTVPVAELHHQLAEKELKPVLKKDALHLQAVNSAPRILGKERIAITGIAIANSLGNDPDEIWQSCIQMKSGISYVPVSRWDHSRYFTRSGNSKGKTYCEVGAFLSLDISRKDLGISPHDFKTMTDSTKLTLWLAQRAIRDSDILSSALPRERIGVIISQNSGEMGSTAEDLTLCVNSEEIAQSIQQHLGLDPAVATEIESVIRAARISIDDTTLLGRLNCTAGGFICNKYGLTGPSYSVSAACATGLVALYSAIQLIRNNVLDAAIVGGGEELLHPASYLEFSALGALAGKSFKDGDPRTASRPFDQERDGMVLGEGGAMIVIERESLALARNKRIYAWITGIGASNNHRGMVESVAETQQLAIDASLRDSGYGADQVDMVECHATATPTGDIEEVKALKAIYPRGSATVLSSFKSQIGHTLGTSGLNSLIRGIWAMGSGLYPPTLNYHTPDPRLDLESWGFRVCSQPEPWPHNLHRPRRFQVNAFGFGGANYVVQVEEANRTAEQGALCKSKQPAAHPALPAAGSLQAVGVQCFQTIINGKDYRIGSIDSHGGAERVRSVLQQHVSVDGSIQSQKLLRAGLYLSDATVASPFGFMFAGQGTHYSQMGHELFETFPVIRHWMKKIAELADFDILHMLFHEKETNLRKTVWQQPALFVLEYAIYQQLKDFNLQPAAMAGHSMGELTALTVAGCFSYEDAFRIISKRAVCMEKASKIAVDPGSMIAVDAPETILEEWVGSNDNLFYTNYNSPRQIVIGGGTREVTELKRKLDELKYWSHILPVSMAFHSPLMRVIRDDLGDYLAGIDFNPPCVPVISNTTRKPYPDDPAAIREIIISHLESPVHWRNNITTLWQDFGVRFFVEIGPRDTLCKLLSDIIPEAEGVHTCFPDHEAESLRKTIAGLFAKGHIHPLQQPWYLHLQESADRRNENALPRDEGRIKEIIQREINAFALDGVERYLMPAIVKALRNEVDPSFQKHELNAYLGGGASGTRINTITAVSVSQAGKEPVTQVPEPVVVPLSREEDILEKVIKIIMDATGYERSELAPAMDIRQDLSIRSSRLPIIMDAAEQTFNIIIKLEEFMDVRTIGDFAARVTKIIDSQGASPKENIPDRLKDTFTATPVQNPGKAHTAIPIQRMVFRRQKVAIPSARKTVSTGGSVLLLSLDADEQVSQVRGILENTHKCSVTHLRVASEGEIANTINLGVAEKVQDLVESLAERGPLSGVVLVSHMNDGGMPLGEVSSFLTGFFAVLQVFLKSSQKAFCLHISYESEHNMVAGLLTEGILGMFLAAKMEYQSVLFRSLRKRRNGSIKEGLELALDTSILPIDLILEEDTIYTSTLCREPLRFNTELSLPLGPEDVLLVSGGGRGVTSFLARALAIRGSRMVLLGRSKDGSPGVSRGKSEHEVQVQSEIQATLAALRSSGASAEYICCDVTDKKQVVAVVDDIRKRYGRIDGIVHGAGVLRDGFIQLLNTNDFRTVLAAKFSGIVNLLDTCGDAVRFVVGLSSIAAITGNVGQVNYCCANRMMASFLSSLHQRKGRLITKTFWLPPVEGVGMVEDPDLKEIIRIKVGENAFLTVSELSAIIVRELLAGPADAGWIVPVRQLPLVPSLVIEEASVQSADDWYDCQQLPLLDRVISVDPDSGTLQAERIFSHAHDLWLHDHKPFSWLSHPIVSAIMIVEAFLETASLSFPYLQAKQLRTVQFSRMLECPEGQEVKAHIYCRTEKENNSDMICHVDFGKAIVQPPIGGEPRRNIYFTGQVVMTAGSSISALPKRDVGMLNSRMVMNQEDIRKYYEKRSGLTGRYRVLNHISNYSPHSITGGMIYPEIRDFSGHERDNYLYPLYVLEGMMQIAGFHAGIREPENPRAIVPAAIAFLNIFRKCASGETLILLGELQAEDDTGILWDVRAYTNTGEAVMQADGLRMNWLN